MKRRSAQLFTVVLLPLNVATGWRHENYSGMKKNELAFTPEALVIRVDSSSSPLLRALPSTTKVKKLEVEATADALPHLDATKPEGEKGNDDYVLRVGLITEGDYRPSWAERIFAPRWILNLLELTPDNAGLGKIHFFNVSQRDGGTEPHANGARMENRTVKKVSAPGDLSFTTTIDPALPVAAVWLHADGDDTKSKFSVTIKKVALTE